MEKKEQTKKEVSQKKGKENLADAKCNDKNCHIHGGLKCRGKTFEGIVIRKFPKRIVLQFERTVYVKKYERYKKSRTKIHARLPDCMKDKINVGDYIKVQECRPLSKIVHFAVIDKIRNAEEKKK